LHHGVHETVTVVGGLFRLDRQGLERLLRYCARPPFGGQRIRIEDEKVVYRCPKAPAGEQGDTSVGGKREHEIVLTPLEFIARIAALVPPPRQHWQRYYGVLAPNAPQRGQVTLQVIPAVTATEGDLIRSLPLWCRPARSDKP
jgi:Putative transposase